MPSSLSPRAGVRDSCCWGRGCGEPIRCCSLLSSCQVRSGQVWQVFLHLNHHLLYTVTSTVAATVYFLLLLLFPANYSLSFDLFLLSFWQEGRLRGEGAGSIVLHFLYYEKFMAFFSVGVLKLWIPFLNHEKIRFSTISELSSEDDFFIN